MNEVSISIDTARTLLRFTKDRRAEALAGINAAPAGSPAVGHHGRVWKEAAKVADELEAAIRSAPPAPPAADEAAVPETSAERMARLRENGLQALCSEDAPAASERDAHASAVDWDREQLLPRQPSAKLQRAWQRSFEPGALD